MGTIGRFYVNSETDPSWVWMGFAGLWLTFHPNLLNGLYLVLPALQLDFEIGFHEPFSAVLEMVFFKAELPLEFFRLNCYVQVHQVL